MPYLPETDYESLDYTGFEKRDCRGAIAPRNDLKASSHKYLSYCPAKGKDVLWPQ